MEKPVREWRNQKRCDPDEGQPREKRVERSENFRSRGLQQIDRAHAALNHGGVQQRIDPTQTGDEMIPENADPQSKGDKNEREQSMPGHAPGEFRATQ